MHKYVGLILVSFIGIIAIGAAHYSSSLLAQEIAQNNGKAEAVLAASRNWSRHQESYKISYGSVWFKPFAQQSFASSGEYKSISTTTSLATSTPKKVPEAPIVKKTKPTKSSTVPTTPKPTTPTTTTPVIISPPVVVTPIPTPTLTPKPTPTPIPTPVPTPTSTAPVVPSGSMEWGVYAGDSNEDVTVVERMVGKKVDIHEIFLSFDDSFPTWVGKSLCPDRKLLIFWENHDISLDSIIAGQYDAYMKKFSDGAAAYGCPVVMAPFHEMNGNWDTWGGMVGNNTPAKLIAAWKHMHDVMAATNITWMWVINNDSVPNTAANAADKYWPGAGYVDTIGIDGFNFNDPWRSFASVFDKAVEGVQKYNKPIYLASLGVVEHANKAAWITEGLGKHIYTYKNVVGWMWFNHNKFDGNWSIDSNAASLAAFKAVIPN